MKNKKCTIEGCDRPFYGRNLCQEHWSYLRNRGELDMFAPRTVHSPNEFIVEGNVVKICLYNYQHEVIDYAIIDLEDMEKCKKHKWHSTKSVYKGRPGKPYVEANTYYNKVRGKLKLHHVILGISSLEDGTQVDHINGDGLDNRKSNLRVCTRSQNEHNRGKNSNNTSGYKGIRFREDRGKWEVRITFLGDVMVLGHFVTLKDAITAYNKKSKELFGKFAYLNPVEEQQDVA